MKEKLTQNPIVAVVAIVALAAGTLLVAGYADRPGDDVQMAADAKCAACPAKGTESCCKAKADSCCGSEQCASCCQDKGCAGACEKEGCEIQAGGCTRDKAGCDAQAGGCTREKAAAASSTTSPCGGQTATPCGTGGCSLAK